MLQVMNLANGSNLNPNSKPFAPRQNCDVFSSSSSSSTTTGYASSSTLSRESLRSALPVSRHHSHPHQPPRRHFLHHPPPPPPSSSSGSLLVRAPHLSLSSSSSSSPWPPFRPDHLPSSSPSKLPSSPAFGILRHPPGSPEQHRAGAVLSGRNSTSNHRPSPPFRSRIFGGLFFPLGV